MQALRAFLRNHRHIAACIVALALAIKALVPTGYMIGAQAHVLTIQICADTQGRQLTTQVVVPGEEQALGHAKGDGLCGWTALASAALGGADLPLLALALAFILLLGTAAVRPVREGRSPHLRPPLRGPPATA